MKGRDPPLGKLSSLDLLVYEPFLFEVELRGVLVEIVDLALERVNMVEEMLIHDKAAEIALLTGYRTVDAYYIAII